jgi:hypothetical protein
MPLFARALRIALVGNFAAAFFLSQAFAATLWTLLGISAAMLGLAKIPPPSEGFRKKKLR